MNIWDYVSFLAGIVAVILLLAVLFEIIQTFINNRKKQSIQDNLMEEAQNTFKKILTKK